VRAARVLFLDQDDLARGQVVKGADHAQLSGLDHVGQDRRRFLQALDVEAHIGDDGTLPQVVARLFSAGSMPDFRKIALVHFARHVAGTMCRQRAIKLVKTLPEMWPNLATM